MIKAIIFDCYGVLTSDGWLPFKEKYFGGNLEKYNEATRLNHLADSGKIPKQQLISMLAVMSNLSFANVNEMIHTNVPNNAIFNNISSLKRQYKIGMLSNTANNRLDVLFSKEQLLLFDEYALSGEIGYAKPDERAYFEIARKLQVECSECLFIDDQPHYIEAARTAGMRAIQYINDQQLQEDVSNTLAADSNK